MCGNFEKDINVQPFTTHRGIAAALEQPNIDTDQIIPARYLVRGRNDGFNDALFADLREAAGFVLNTLPAKNASILVVGDNFGCGSSREHAVWALADYGIRVVIAPSFADIFFNNALQNGLLVIPAPIETLQTLFDGLVKQPETEIAVDLLSQTVASDIVKFGFDIDAGNKEALLQGLSQTEGTLKLLAEIERHERLQSDARPWLSAPRSNESSSP
jgi:3-isopropylmalate/(R)-2-methylmalate dehydratase small subunit